MERWVDISIGIFLQKGRFGETAFVMIYLRSEVIVFKRREKLRRFEDERLDGGLDGGGQFDGSGRG